MIDSQKSVWHMLRHHIGRMHPIKTAELSSATGLSRTEVTDAIRALRREHYMRIGYSRSRPVGYYIIISEDEARDSTAHLYMLIAQSVRQIAILSRMPASEVMSEVLNQSPSLPNAADLAFRDDGLTERQAIHLSHLALTSELEPDEADEIYRLIADARTIKKDAIPVIDRIRKALERRALRREASKERRINYHEMTHPKRGIARVKKRDLARHNRDWERAIEDVRKALWG